MKYLLLIITIGTAASAAGPGEIQRIVGGDDTTVEKYPYMASMEYYNQVTWSQPCGGTLISAQSVLSAAHCFYDTMASSWRVRLGSNYPSQGGTVHEVSTLIPHENYDYSTLVNDIAIVRLTDPVIFSDVISVAKIAGNMYHLSDRTPVVAIGWGSISISGPPAEILQEVEIEVINQVVCRDRYNILTFEHEEGDGYTLDDGMICTGLLNFGGKDACTGDSGGPVLHNDVIIGITSWGHECANETYPRVNARVSYYSNWIIANNQI